MSECGRRGAFRFTECAKWCDNCRNILGTKPRHGTVTVTGSGSEIAHGQQCAAAVAAGLGAVGASTQRTSRFNAAGAIFIAPSIDTSGELVDVRLSETRGMAAATAFFQSAKTVIGITPARVATDGHYS